MEIKIDIDQVALHARPLEERMEFQTMLFDVGSRLTSQHKAQIDFSDPMHWTITIPEEHEAGARLLLEAAEIPVAPQT